VHHAGQLRVDLLRLIWSVQIQTPDENLEILKVLCIILAGLSQVCPLVVTPQGLYKLITVRSPLLALVLDKFSQSNYIIHRHIYYKVWDVQTYRRND
jgi:hypothetical protein